jgi:hypothetical protein
VAKPNVGFWKQLCEWEVELGLGEGKTEHPDKEVVGKFSGVVIGQKVAVRRAVGLCCAVLLGLGCVCAHFFLSCGHHCFLLIRIWY